MAPKPSRFAAAAAHPLGLALLFSTGLLAAFVLPLLPDPRWLLAAAVPAWLPWRGRAGYAVLLLGALLGVWRLGDGLATRWPVERHGEQQTVRGFIASLPEVETNARGERLLRFEFRPAPGEDVQTLVRVSWYRSDAMPRAGECWQLELRLRSPHGSLNPGGFDYEAWLFRQGVGAVAGVRGGERCVGDGGPWWLRWRQRQLDRLRAALPDHPGLALLAAITLGDTSGLGAKDWDAFRATGTTHLVAVSGFNVAFVAAIAFLLGRWAWSPWPWLCRRWPAQKAGMLAAAITGGLYAFAAGWEPPVQRAALMLGLLLAAGAGDRERDPRRVLALAWIAVLVLDPLAVLSPGLWLSFAAVLTIFYVTAARLRPGNAARESLRVQLALSVALLPLSLGFFDGLSLVSAPINLLAVPVIAVLTPIGLLGLIALGGGPDPGTLLLGVTASALSECERGLMLLAAWSDGAWWAANPPRAALALAAFGVGLLLAPRGLPTRWLGLACLLPLALPPRAMPRSGFEITALDVGQGLAVVVRTASHTLLYDAGPAFDDGFDAGESVVLPYLLRIGTRRLDAVVISHLDQDHVGGYGAVARRLRIARRLGTPDGGEACRDGTRWRWDGVDFAILHPDAAVWGDNEGSCVLRVSAGERVLLLAGDIERAAEQRLLREHAAALRAGVLMAPHHGSRSSSSAEFVAAVRPRVVIYSAGWRNRFGHPRPEVVGRYAAVGARGYVTGVGGAITLRPDTGDGWAVDEHRRQAARLWNAAPDP